MNTTRHPKHRKVWIGVTILGILLLAGCAGTFETKTELTAICQTNWEEQAGIPTSSLPHPEDRKGLHLLVFNIHDRILPASSWFQDGKTEESLACIGDLAKRFDLVFAQEAFVRPAQLARYTRHYWAHHPLFTEGGGGDWWPLRVFCEICLSPGLLMLAREKPEFIHAEPYTAFAGWNTELNKADDFFSKGFQLVQFQQFWALNSHMDAGRGQDSIDARRLQFQQITAALQRVVPRTAPLIVGMDANLRPDKEEQDLVILQEFLTANGLTLIQHHGPDLLAARNLRVSHPRILSLRNILSDHNALSAILHPSSALSTDPSD